MSRSPLSEETLKTFIHIVTNNPRALCTLIAIVAAAGAVRWYSYHPRTVPQDQAHNEAMPPMNDLNVTIVDRHRLYSIDTESARAATTADDQQPSSKEKITPPGAIIPAEGLENMADYAPGPQAPEEASDGVLAMGDEANLPADEVDSDDDTMVADSDDGYLSAEEYHDEDDMEIRSGSRSQAHGPSKLWGKDKTGRKTVKDVETIC